MDPVGVIVRRAPRTEVKVRAYVVMDWGGLRLTVMGLLTRNCGKRLIAIKGTGTYAIYAHRLASSHFCFLVLNLISIL